MPVFGHLLRMGHIMKTYGSPDHPWVHMTREDFPDKLPRAWMNFPGFAPIIFLRDLDMIQDLFVNKNKYFDKSEYTWRVLYPLFGDGIAFVPSNEEWAMRRKHVSVAFYKEKLLKFAEIMKGVVHDQMKEWEKKAATGENFNLIPAVQTIYQKIILSCAFGKDISELPIDFV
jgi:cytochrome P450